ncbi:MAG TPA: SGNH family hydrolase, partial [Xanthobacteraceae bacterium]|nr:SGNH family hydrolase [Xanthobacteraceae bacterium]
MALKPALRGKTRWRACALLIAVAAFALWMAVPVRAQTEIDAAAGRVRVAQSFFDRLFSPFPRDGLFPAPRPEPQRPADYSRAPPPRKPDTPPTATIMVLGDSLADWLAYGLEEALVDTPEIGVVRKARAGSGLIRYDLRNESQDWPQAIREILATEKPNYLVMMIGLNDRQAIRVRQGQARPPTSSEKPQDQEQDPEDAERRAEMQRQRAPGLYEFQSERWEELYIQSIDEVIAVLKSRGVPVFWVGLPPLRGQKATNDASYLNDLFRAQAEKAGIVYVDVWDGFVDEQGRFTLQGPDFEGQNRRLRTGDGIHFTKAGARKLAHYLEREINRVAPLQAVAVAPPEPQPQTPSPRPGGPTARPLNGPA